MIFIGTDLSRHFRRTQLLAKEVVQFFLHRTPLSVLGKHVRQVPDLYEAQC
jgi:hypothetical protein